MTKEQRSLLKHQRDPDIPSRTLSQWSHQSRVLWSCKYYLCLSSTIIHHVYLSVPNSPKGTRPHHTPEPPEEALFLQWMSSGSAPSSLQMTELLTLSQAEFHFTACICTFILSVSRCRLGTERYLFPFSVDFCFSDFLLQFPLISELVLLASSLFLSSMCVFCCSAFFFFHTSCVFCFIRIILVLFFPLTFFFLNFKTVIGANLNTNVSGKLWDWKLIYLWLKCVVRFLNMFEICKIFDQDLCVHLQMCMKNI